MNGSRQTAPVAGILLAAGASSRMGEDKLFLRVGGETLLRRAAGEALGAGLDPLLAVVRAGGEREQCELSRLRARVVENPDAARGAQTSLRRGLAAVPEQCAAAVVLLADMPFVTARMIRSLVARWRAGTTALVLSDYAGVQAPPTLFDRSLFRELSASEEEGAAREVVRRHAGDAAVVGFPAASLADVDAPDDYDRARRLWEAEAGKAGPERP